MTERLTLGVEEEFFLVDGRTRVVSDAGPVLGAVSTEDPHDGIPPYAREFRRSMIESRTSVCDSLDELRGELQRLRGGLVEAAQEENLRVVAAGSAPLIAWTPPGVTPAPRYERMAEAYQQLAREQLICACQVHVGIHDEDLAVGVLNRIRAWLPTIVALFASSPFWMAADTGYASYRTMLWQRWPTAGMPGLFASAADYRTAVQSLVRSGVIADAGQIYWTVRLNQTHNTLEVRAADACTTIDEAVAYSGLSRALVRACLDEGRDQRRFHAVRPEMLAAARWRAARSGLDDVLIDPVTAEPLPASVMVDRLMGHVRPALEDVGDWDEVSHLIERTMAGGTSAARQRAAYRRTGRLEDVVDMLARETALT
ncbi:MAG: glutamate--cysteine ligase [Actinomycetota bacterium]|nr:glutamate--cysteine ligase [Actinomycetota bacterium]